MLHVTVGRAPVHHVHVRWLSIDCPASHDAERMTVDRVSDVCALIMTTPTNGVPNEECPWRRRARGVPSSCHRRSRETDEKKGNRCVATSPLLYHRLHVAMRANYGTVVACGIPCTWESDVKKKSSLRNSLHTTTLHTTYTHTHTHMRAKKKDRTVSFFFGGRK